MTAWRARAGVMAVFALGFFCGAAAVYLYVLHIEQQVLRAPDTVAQLILMKLDRELDLTDQQRDQIHEVIRATRAEILHNSETALPRLIAIFDHSQAEIRTFLDPKQQARFDEMVRGRKERLLKDIREHSK